MAAKKAAKVAKVMGEYKRGTLKSSSGRKVTSRQQAVAIAMSEAKMTKKKNGKKPPIPKEFYDRPYQKRQPRDKDDVLVSRIVRGQRTVLRKDPKGSKKKVNPKPQFHNLPAKPQGAWWNLKA